MSRLGYIIVAAGLLAVSVGQGLKASAWPGVALATVGALLVAIEGLAQWAARAESAVHAAASAERLDVLEARLARLAERLETAERRDALGRM